MEGYKRLTPEEIDEYNKQRAKTIDRMMTDGGKSYITDSGGVGISPSEKTILDAQKEMRREQAHTRLYEKYKDLIGRRVHVMFSENLESSAPLYQEEGWRGMVPFVRGKGSSREIDAVLKSIDEGVAILEFEGKEIEVFLVAVDEMLPAD